MEKDNEANKDIVVFSTREEVGALAEALKVFQQHKVNLLRIESRSSKRQPGNYEFIVEIDNQSGDVNAALETLKQQSAYMQIISRNYKDGQGWWLNASGPTHSAVC